MYWYSTIFARYICVLLSVHCRVSEHPAIIALVSRDQIGMHAAVKTNKMNETYTQSFLNFNDDFCLTLNDVWSLLQICNISKMVLLCWFHTCAKTISCWYCNDAKMLTLLYCCKNYFQSNGSNIACNWAKYSQLYDKMYNEYWPGLGYRRTLASSCPSIFQLGIILTNISVLTL